MHHQAVCAGGLNEAQKPHRIAFTLFYSRMWSTFETRDPTQNNSPPPNGFRAMLSSMCDSKRTSIWQTAISDMWRGK